MAIEEVQSHLKRKNKILFSRDSDVLDNLTTLIEMADRKVAVLWALDIATGIVLELDGKYPEIKLFEQSLNLAYLWMQGMVKMPAVKKAILKLHGLAKFFEQDPVTMPDGLKIRALAHGLSSIHSKKHAIGMPLYYLSALVQLDKEGYELPVRKEIKKYQETLEYYIRNEAKFNVHWAGFLENS